jgi:hypothetical protein
VLAVCSVSSLYRAFPPPDPPVYSRPQLKPPRGICCFTTTTFGSHRGADQGAGRITSGWDLDHLLGGSTSATPPSTADVLQLPGLTSTRPGRYSVVPDLHRHLWAGTRLPRAGIGGSRPTYLCPGTPLAGLYYFWPEFAFPGRNMSIPAFFGRNSQVLGRNSCFPAGMGRHSGKPAGPGHLCPGGLATDSSRPAHPGLPAAALLSRPGLARGLAPLGHPGPSRQPAKLRLGCNPGAATRQASPPAGPGRARPTRPLLFAGWHSGASQLGRAGQAALALSSVRLGHGRASLSEFCYGKSSSQVPKVTRLCQLVFRSISHDKS